MLGRQTGESHFLSEGVKPNSRRSPVLEPLAYDCRVLLTCRRPFPFAPSHFCPVFSFPHFHFCFSHLLCAQGRGAEAETCDRVLCCLAAVLQASVHSPRLVHIYFLFIYFLLVQRGCGVCTAVTIPAYMCGCLCAFAGMWEAGC